MLVNNAGYYAFGALEETSPDELRDQLETNVVGVQRVTRAVLPAMRARRAGTVVTLGLGLGQGGGPDGRPVPRVEVGAGGMIEAWRLELLPFGVRVAADRAGPVPTPSCTPTSGWPRPAAARTALRRPAGQLPAAGGQIRARRT